VRRWQALLIGIGIGFNLNLLAEAPQAASHPTFEEFKKLREAEVPAVPTKGSTLTILSICSGWETKVREECVNTYAEYFRYETSVFKQRQAVFDFQLVSTKLILVMVMLLVLAGLTFAGVQFWLSFKAPVILQAGPPKDPKVVTASEGHTDKKPGLASAEVVADKQLTSATPTVGTSDSPPPISVPPSAFLGAPDLATDFEVSATGFKVKSSVLGLLLMLISMCFFYLYLRYVYPVQNEMDQPNVTVPSEQAKTPKGSAEK
jgi:hypothetical protein